MVSYSKVFHRFTKYSSVRNQSLEECTAVRSHNPSVAAFCVTQQNATYQNHRRNRFAQKHLFSTREGYSSTPDYLDNGSLSDILVSAILFQLLVDLNRYQCRILYTADVKPIAEQNIPSSRQRNLCRDIFYTPKKILSPIIIIIHCIFC